MTRADLIEGAIAGELKARSFRKRGRTWFRVTSAGEYQAVNLQKSAWGRGCYLNLGWDPVPPEGGFQAEMRCPIRYRAEVTGVIDSIRLEGPDGASTQEPGISMLDADWSPEMDDDSFVGELRRAVVLPVAELMDRTPSIADLVPLLRTKATFVTVEARKELERRGHELP